MRRPREAARFARKSENFSGVDPDWVVVTTGASEALSVLLCPAGRQRRPAVAGIPGL
jgi:hypothetical protein